MAIENFQHETFSSKVFRCLEKAILDLVVANNRAILLIFKLNMQKVW